MISYTRNVFIFHNWFDIYNSPAYHTLYTLIISAKNKPKQKPLNNLFFRDLKQYRQNSWG